MTPTHTGGGAGARHSRGRRGPPPRTLGGKAEASVPRWAPPPVGNTDLAGGQVPWRGPGGASAPPPLRPAGTALATAGKRPGRPQAREVQQGVRTARARPPCPTGGARAGVARGGGPRPAPGQSGQALGSPSCSRGARSRERARSSAVGLAAVSSLGPELVISVLGDVPHPGQGLVAALLDDLQVAHLDA